MQFLFCNLQSVRQSIANCELGIANCKVCSRVRPSPPALACLEFVDRSCSTAPTSVWNPRIIGFRRLSCQHSRSRRLGATCYARVLTWPGRALRIAASSPAVGVRLQGGSGSGLARHLPHMLRPVNFPLTRSHSTPSVMLRAGSGVFGGKRLGSRKECFAPKTPDPFTPSRS